MYITLVSLLRHYVHTTMVTLRSPLFNYLAFFQLVYAVDREACELPAISSE